MRNTFLSIACSIALNSGAQVWAPTEAVWHYSFSSGFGAMGFVRITVGNDTTVQGRTCKILEKRSIGHDFANGVDYDGSIGEEITFDSVGLVLIYDPVENTFDTLFNLNAAPGDSWILASRPNAAVCAPTSYATVLDTGTRTIQGVPLKWIKVDVQFSPEDLSVYSYTDTIFERIGPVASYLLPHDVCNEALDGQQGGPFRCYQDGQLNYQRIADSSCEAPLFVPRVSDPRTAWAIPNPGSDHFTLPLHASEGSTLTVHDVMGRVVLHDRNVAGSSTIGAAAWPQGLYHILFQGRDGTAHVTKWIKQ